MTGALPCPGCGGIVEFNDDLRYPDDLYMVVPADEIQGLNRKARRAARNAGGVLVRWCGQCIAEGKCPERAAS